MYHLALSIRFAFASQFATTVAKKRTTILRHNIEYNMVASRLNGMLAWRAYGMATRHIAFIKLEDMKRL